MLTNSAVHNAPAKLINPAITQQRITNVGEPSSCAIGAIFLKTPEPIMTLTTKKVADLNAILGLSFSNIII